MSLPRLWSRSLDRRQHFSGLEEIQRAVHDLDEFDSSALVDDEVRPLRVAIDRARLVRLHRVIGGEHLPAKIREEELLGFLILLPRGQSKVVIGADAHDLGANGFELRQGRLEAV